MKLEDGAKRTYRGLAAIRKLCDTATPGPWTIPSSENTDDIIRGADAFRVCGSCCCGGFRREADGQFVVAARTLLPLLLDVADAARRCRVNGRWSPDGLAFEVRGLSASLLSNALVALDSVSGAGVENDAAEREEES